MKKIFTLLLVIIMITVGLTSCTSEAQVEPTATEASVVDEKPEATTEPSVVDEKPEATTEPEETPVAIETMEVLEHSSIADFVFNTEPGKQINIAEFFQVYGLDVKSMITSKGGDVSVSGKPTTMPTPKEDYTIGLAIHNTSDIVGKTIFEQMQKACDEIGVKYLLNDAALDQNIQNAAIESWVATDKVDAVIVYPRNYSAVGPALNELADASIPTLVGITPLQGVADLLTLIPNEEMGAAAAEYLISGLEDAGKELKGKIIYGTLNIVHPNVPGREFGFFKVMENYPDIEIIKIEGTAVDAFYQQMETFLVRDNNNEIIGAWGLYSGAMLGMSQAIEANDRPDITMVGIDYDQKVMADIKEGKINATIGHNPVIVGYWNVANIVNLLNGAEVPAITRIPYDVITADNVDEMYELYFPGAGTLAEYMNTAE